MFTPEPLSSFTACWWITNHLQTILYKTCINPTCLVYIGSRPWEVRIFVNSVRLQDGFNQTKSNSLKLKWISYWILQQLELIKLAKPTWKWLTMCPHKTQTWSINCILGVCMCEWMKGLLTSCCFVFYFCVHYWS